MSDELRLFVGVEVSMAAVADLADAASAMRAAAESSGAHVRWVAPSRYHVTLKFIGWARRDALAAIGDSLARAFVGVSGFDFKARGVGAFPKSSKARVIWAGAHDPSGNLARLASAADEALALIGIAADTRPFHPHVTLGRVKGFADVDNVLLPWSEQEFSNTRVDAVTLYESTVKTGSSDYVRVAEFRLESASKRAKRQTESLKRRSHEGTDGARPGPSSPRTDHTDHIGEHAHGDPDLE